jgi:hypothetical protein
VCSGAAVGCAPPDNRLNLWIKTFDSFEHRLQHRQIHAVALAAHDVWIKCLKNRKELWPREVFFYAVDNLDLVIMPNLCREISKSEGRLDVITKIGRLD